MRDHRALPAPAPALVVGSVVSVQSGAALATSLFPAVGPGGAVWLRIMLSAVLVLAVVRPDVRRLGRHELALAAVYGVVLAAMNASFYAAIERVPLGIAVTVEFLGPLGLAVAGSRRARDVLWVVLAAGGVVLLAGSPGSIDGVGLALAAVAGVFWAAYILMAQRVGQVIPGLAGLGLALGVGAIGLAPYGIVSGGTALLRPGVLLRGAGVAVLSSAIPYSLELAALRRLRASVFGVLMSMEPAVAALCGLVFLGQHLAVHEWLAVGLVMVASVGAARNGHEPTDGTVAAADATSAAEATALTRPEVGV